MEQIPLSKANCRLAAQAIPLIFRAP